MPTIIFLSGLGVPKFLAKSKFVWDDSLWKDYDRTYITSKIPSSDMMVEKEIDNLCDLISQYDNPIVAGHSLGAWWVANLICCSQFKAKKTVLWTPLGDLSQYPMFNITISHHPINKIPNSYNVGPHKSLLFPANNDLIVPSKIHSNIFIDHLNPIVYKLNGGHFYQSNHKAGLMFMKDWSEL